MPEPVKGKPRASAARASRAAAADPSVIVPHEVSWTPERVQRFWDYYSSNPALEDTYFAKTVGRDLIATVAERITLGTVLDMGCGRGDLTGYLLEKYDVVAADLSRDSVGTVERRFSGHPRFRGVTVGTASLADDSVDTIFIVEVVEHLEDDPLQAVLSEARRLLKPGGHLVLTTPNDENLEANKVICPECACVFHRVQHVRSWTTDRLAAHVGGLGFDGSAFATRLFPDTGVRQWARRVQARVLRHNNPHMIYIGKKR